MKPCYTHCVGVVICKMEHGLLVAMSPLDGHRHHANVGVVLCKMEHGLLVVMSPLHGHIHQANVDGWGIKTSMF